MIRRIQKLVTSSFKEGEVAMHPTVEQMLPENLSKSATYDSFMVVTVFMLQKHRKTVLCIFETIQLQMVKG